MSRSSPRSGRCRSRSPPILNINFLRKPEQRDLIAEVRLIKLGKRLAVGEVEIYSDGNDEMVAHATATYSIPPPEHRG